MNRMLTLIYYKRLVFFAVNIYSSTFVLLLLLNQFQYSEEKFLCKGRSVGYYADVESGCQMYHMCDGHGRQFTYNCPNATLFQQRMLICDHWYMVNCTNSEEQFKVNLVIGHKGKLFVEDTNPYQRTARPHLNPTRDEINIIYRKGKQRYNEKESLTRAASTANRIPHQLLVAQQSAIKQQYHTTTTTSKSNSVRQPTQNNAHKKLPLHSTNEFHKIATDDPPSSTVLIITPKPVTTTQDPRTYRFVKTQRFSVVENTTSGRGIAHQLPGEAFSKSNNHNVIPQQPLRENHSIFNSSSITSSRPPPSQLNSDSSSSSPVQIDHPLVLDLLPPEIDYNFVNSNRPELRTSSTAERKTPEFIQPPSKFYQPPFYEPDHTGGNNLQQKRPFTLPEQDIELLSKKFLIPDYEFPLDTAIRPNYSTAITSFQVNKQ